MNFNETPESPNLENRLRELSPRAASSDLQKRIEKSLASQKRTSRNQIIAMAAAAAIAVGAFLFFSSNAPSSKTDVPTEIAIRPVGHQKVLVEAAEPVLVQAPGAAPMWQIDLKMLNRAFIETPDGVQPSRFVPENRSVFMPVVYQ